MNKKRFATIIGLGAIVLTLGTYGFTYPVYVPVRSVQPVYASNVHGPERHPELSRALRNLQRAQESLVKAGRDFKGHRAAALKLTNKAIDEVNAAMQSDKN